MNFNMKGFTVLLLVVLAAVAHSAHVRGASRNQKSVVGVDECPQEQQINWEIEWLMRHEDCNKFYKCAFGKPVEYRCYGNLHFNLDTWQCDWPYNVDCNGRNIPDSHEDNDVKSTTVTAVPPIIDLNPTSPSTTTTTTTTPAPTTTTTTTTTTPAPTTTTTTPAPTTTTTTTTTPVPTTTSSTTTTPSGFLPNGCPVDPHIHWLLPHEYDCNLFYYCVWGTTVLRQCPANLHFNTKIQVCDWPAAAGCTLTGSPRNNDALSKWFNM